jgi:DNA-binding NarL/FixJ family response regulator
MVTKLLLLDDREAIREGFKLLLHTQADFQVIADVASPVETYAAIDKGEVDVAIVSHDLAGISGAAVTRELVRRQTRLKVISFSLRSDEDAVREALSSGARGFMLRQQPAAQVFEAIREVAQGHTYLAPRISHLLVQDHLRLHRGERAQPGPCDRLSRRERDVFDLLVRGHNNQKISRLLGISTKTVETHRAHVLRKLEVHSIVDLIRFAARHQLPLE